MAGGKACEHGQQTKRPRGWTGTRGRSTQGARPAGAPAGVAKGKKANEIGKRESKGVTQVNSKGQSSKEEQTQSQVSRSQRTMVRSVQAGVATAAQLQSAAEAERTEDLAEGLYPDHAKVWQKYVQLTGQLLHPRIRGYLMSGKRPKGWKTAKLIRVIQTAAKPSFKPDTHALFVVTQTSQMIGRVGIILGRTKREYSVVFLDNEKASTKCRIQATELIDARGFNRRGTWAYLPRHTEEKKDEREARIRAEEIKAKRKREERRRAAGQSSASEEQSSDAEYEDNAVEEESSEEEEEEPEEEEPAEEEEAEMEETSEEESEEEVIPSRKKRRREEDAGMSEEQEDMAPAQPGAGAAIAEDEVPGSWGVLDRVTMGDVEEVRQWGTQHEAQMYLGMRTLGLGIAGMAGVTTAPRAAAGQVVLEILAGMSVGFRGPGAANDVDADDPAIAPKMVEAVQAALAVKREVPRTGEEPPSREAGSRQLSREDRKPRARKPRKKLRRPVHVRDETQAVIARKSAPAEPAQHEVQSEAAQSDRESERESPSEEPEEEVNEGSESDQVEEQPEEDSDEEEEVEADDGGEASEEDKVGNTVAGKRKEESAKTAEEAKQKGSKPVGGKKKEEPAKKVEGTKQKDRNHTGGGEEPSSRAPQTDASKQEEPGDSLQSGAGSGAQGPPKGNRKRKTPRSPNKPVREKTGPGRHGKSGVEKVPPEKEVKASDSKQSRSLGDQETGPVTGLPDLSGMTAAQLAALAQQLQAMHGQEE